MPTEDDDLVSVRLAWPDHPLQPAERPTGPPTPQPDDRQPRDDEAGRRSEPDNGQPGEEAQKTLDSPGPASTAADAALLAPSLIAVDQLADGGRLGRVLADLYDRLGQRIAEQFRQLRYDLDDDLGSLRAELGDLRAELGDISDRVQLRHVKSAIDELRQDVAGLRHVVLDWPQVEEMATALGTVRRELGEVASGVARVLVEVRTTDPRAELGDLAAAIEQVLVDVRTTDPRAELADLAAAIEQVAAQQGEAVGSSDVLDAVGLLELKIRTATEDLTSQAERGQSSVVEAAEAALAIIQDTAAEQASDRAQRTAAVDQALDLVSVLDELRALRDEITTLKRRIALRAAAEPVVTDEQIGDIVEEVAERVTAAMARDQAGRSGRR